ncbi:MAG: Flp family type IVb pilin [Pseudomonadota bacterium]
MFKRLFSSKGGAAGVEYGMIAGLIGLAIVSSATNLGSASSDSYQTSATKIQSGPESH